MSDNPEKIYEEVKEAAVEKINEALSQTPPLEKPTLGSMGGFSPSDPQRKSILTESDTPLMIWEQLEAARAYSRRTGKRVQKIFNKKEFIQQFPHAGSDPRMAFTPESFIFDLTPMETMTVGQLRDLCIAVKDLPFAFEKAMQVEGFSDDVVVHLLKEDVQKLRNAAK